MSDTDPNTNPVVHRALHLVRSMRELRSSDAFQLLWSELDAKAQQAAKLALEGKTEEVRAAARIEYLGLLAVKRLPEDTEAGQLNVLSQHGVKLDDLPQENAL